MTTARDVLVRLREAEARADFAENLITAAGVLSEAGIHPDHPDCQRLFHEIIRLPDEDAMREAVLREAASAPTSEAGKSYADASPQAPRDGRQGTARWQLSERHGRGSQERHPGDRARQRSDARQGAHHQARQSARRHRCPARRLGQLNR
jgi:hypothetical protein